MKIDAIKSTWEQVIFWAIGILIGFGPWLPVTALFVVIVTVFSLRVHLRIELRTAIQLLFFIGLLVSYHITAKADIRPIDAAKVIFYSYSIIVVVLSISTKVEATNFLFAIAIGLLIHAAIVTFVTVMTLDPPYYGRTLSPFTGEEANSPGFSNMATFFVIMFVTCQSIPSYQIKGRVWLMLAVTGLIVSLIIGVLLAGRTYFIIILCLIVFILIRRFRTSKNIFRLLIFIITFVALDTWLSSVSLTYWDSRELIFSRFDEQGLETARTVSYDSWLKQFLNDPFEYTVAPIYPSRWFHNFWMDLHADAGFWPLMLSTAMMLFASFHLTYIFRSDRNLFSIWFPIFSATLLILASSVVTLLEPLFFLLAAQSLVFVKFSSAKKRFRRGSLWQLSDTTKK